MPDPGPLHEPSLRVMALHALLYCERLFYLEEVEGLRVADDKVYAGRELHAGIEAADGDSVESIDLESSKLGLRGRIDVVKRRDGTNIPYEHKRGRCRRGDGNEAEPWPSDEAQAGAYALMLEETTGERVPEARVRYHRDNVTVRVPIDDDLRGRVGEAVRRAGELRNSVHRPPITDNENLCRSCSLAPVCLPEETRKARDPERRATRLFPAEDHRTSLHVVSQGARVGRSKDRLVVTPRDGSPTKHPSHEVSAVLLHGFAQISTQALRLCADQEIAVQWLTNGGRHIASTTTTPGRVQRRLRQYEALTDHKTCLRLAKQLVLARAEGQLRYLLRATRQDRARRSKIAGDLNAIRATLKAIPQAENRDSLRGHEGEAAVRYWRCFDLLLNDAVPQELRYAGRSRRPPTDRLSAILNFGYALLESAVMRAVLAAGLEPALGFYHTPRSEAHPLVLDLMEMFRVPLWDMVAVGSLNRAQWDPEDDFRVTKAMVWLSDQGRKKAIGLFEDRLQERWKHPVVDYSLSYARSIELEARLLEKEWSGEAGPFARLRLR